MRFHHEANQLNKCEADRAVGRLFSDHYADSRVYPLPAEPDFPVSLPSNSLHQDDIQARIGALRALQERLRQMTDAVEGTERAYRRQEKDFMYLDSEDNNGVNQLRSDIAALEAQHANSAQSLALWIEDLQRIAQEKDDPLQLKADLEAFIDADPKHAFSRFSESRLLSMFGISAMTEGYDELISDSKVIISSGSSVFDWFTAHEGLKKKWNERAKIRLGELEPILAGITARENRLKQDIEPMEARLRFQAAHLAELRQEFAVFEAAMTAERKALDDTSVRLAFVRVRRDVARYELDYTEVDHHLIALEQARQDLQNRMTQEPGDAVEEHIHACQSLLQACEPDAAMKALQSELPARREELEAQLNSLSAQLPEHTSELRTRLDSMNTRTLTDLPQELVNRVSEHVQTLRNALEQARQASFVANSPSIEDTDSPAHHVSTPLSPESDDELSVGESDGPIAVIEEKRATPLPKNLADYYRYADKPRDGVHRWAHASTSPAFFKSERRHYQFIADGDTETKQLRGDRLKARILAYFKAAIEGCENREELTARVADIRRNSVEHKIIATSQGLLTSLVGKTDALKAFNEMVQDKYDQLDSGPKFK